MKGYSVLEKQDISELETLLKTPEGEYRNASVSELEEFKQEQICQFCLQEGLYQVITAELLDCVSRLIEGKKTIEIGAGAGQLGSQLGIVMTDNKMQERPEVKQLYQMMRQPTIKYHKDIIKIDGNKAVEELNPEIVLAAWITAQFDYQGNPLNALGIVEEPIVELVDYYIIVGNETTHDNKAILHKYDHYRIKADWIFSRSMSKENNVIYIIAKDLKQVDINRVSDMDVIIDKVEI